MLVAALLLGACGSAPRARRAVTDAGADAAPDAGVDAGTDAGGPGCPADREGVWTYSLPAECAGKRTCIDARRRFWVDGEPFVPRGVYNGGFEWDRTLDNCPAGEACQATTPTDVDDYLRILGDGGFNLVMERSRFTPELTDAIAREDRIRIAHLLWSDPFTVEGHDALVAEIEPASADPEVVMWFGPDESDLNDSFPMSAGIRRILFGANDDLDALLAGKYDPGGTPYLPEGEPAHDPNGLPYGAALAWDWGLAQGTNVYDVLLPIAYPFESGTHAANDGRWGTWRVSALEGEGAPVLPVLQMIGIPIMGLSHPTPAQIEALVASALAHGARGAFHYNLIGDQPTFAGRDGWFAPDDADGWAAWTRMNALEDSLIPVLYSDGIEEMGEANGIEWRRWTLGDRVVVLFVNPTADLVRANLYEVLGMTVDDVARRWDDCAPIDPVPAELAGYAWLIAEVGR